MSEPIHITVTGALERLEQAVEEYGLEWVDPHGAADDTCVNVYWCKGEIKHCIAAKVLSLYGVPDELLEVLDGSLEQTVGDLVRDGTVTADRNAVVVLASAQAMQDRGHTWGEAHRHAERIAAVLKMPLEVRS